MSGATPEKIKCNGDWRGHLSSQPIPHTLPEMMHLALDMAAEDAYDMSEANAFRLGRKSSKEEPFNAREAFEQEAGYDLYDAIQVVLDAMPAITEAVRVAPVGAPVVDREALMMLLAETAFIRNDETPRTSKYAYDGATPSEADLLATALFASGIVVDRVTVEREAAEAMQALADKYAQDDTAPRSIEPEDGWRLLRDLEKLAAEYRGAAVRAGETT